MLSPPSENHYRTVVDAIQDSDVVPVLGAGANLCGRPADTAWRIGEHLPSGADLAEHLAREFRYAFDQPDDLGRVAQFIALMRGYPRLYRELHKVFDADYPPTPLHELLAALPARLRSWGARHQLIITTNYDDALERAFQAIGERYDLISYQVDGNTRGKFLHWAPDDGLRTIETNEYPHVSLDRRTVILKIHGLVHRGDVPPELESFVITEDHYIDYLARASNLADLLPASINETLAQSHLLFLGYSLRDWNVRVMLHHIWTGRELGVPAWAVQLNAAEIDVRFWAHRDIEILDVPLDEYIATLSRELDEFVPAGQ